MDFYGKYARIILLKDNEGIIITDAFQKILKEANRTAVDVKSNTNIDSSKEIN